MIINFMKNLFYECSRADSAPARLHKLSWLDKHQDHMIIAATIIVFCVMVFCAWNICTLY